MVNFLLKEEDMTINNNFIYKDSGHMCRFILRCFINTALCLIGVFIGLKLLMPCWSDIIRDATIFDINKLSERDVKILNMMISQNKLYTADFVIERLISFYEMLIQFLIGAFAILAISGFIYIKFSYRRDINEALIDYVHSKPGQLILKELFQQYLQTMEIKPIVEEVFNAEKSDGDIAGLIEDNEKIHEQLDVILNEQGNMREVLDNLTQNSDNNINVIDIPNQEDGD